VHPVRDEGGENRGAAAGLPGGRAVA
jgi:hypothetical protein